MILHCEIQTGPMSPDWGHMPLSSPVTKILMWHNINIRDVTHDIVILQMKAPAPSHLLDLSRVVTGRVVIPLYFYLWTKRGQWGDSGDERIFIWLDKYTRRLASWQIIIEQPRIDILWILCGLFKLCVNTFNNYLRNRCKWQIRKIFGFDLSVIWRDITFKKYVIVQNLLSLMLNLVVDRIERIYCQSWNMPFNVSHGPQDGSCRSNYLCGRIIFGIEIKIYVFTFWVAAGGVGSSG